MSVAPVATSADAPTEQPVVAVLGIRHHGPGSARSMLRALAELRPDAVLVEGPADADPLLALSTAPGMVPPLSLLAYAVDDPAVAAFWPFAVFSPEWQAITWARRAGVPVSFCDLPAAQSIALHAPRDGPLEAPERPRRAVRRDPLGALAEAAGYDDPERWWDDVVESRLDGASPFPALVEAMAELRAAEQGSHPGDPDEERREAHMRQVLRATLKAGHRRVAVVCGAWHAPALSGPLPPAAHDLKVLRGTPRRRVEVTWVPWTHSRLAAASGYGAGVTSPGWYHHLWTAPDRPVTRWLTAVATSLRERDLPVSTAHVIDAVRLAEHLAALRGRPLAGLDEVEEATRSVLCGGDELVARFVTEHLVVGESLGSVAAEVPTVPLEADLVRTCRTLKVRREAVVRKVDLDLRKPQHLGRSRLFHRLRLLGIDWARPARSDVQGTGTFRETWQLEWQPELSVRVVEAAVWGTTVESAAAARVEHVAQHAGLPELTRTLERCLAADLPGPFAMLLRGLDAQAARDVDVAHLMEALPALVRAQRYGDVRGTDVSALARVSTGFVLRVCAGLPQALTGLDDEAAADMRGLVDGVHAAVALLAGADAAAGEVRDRWLDALRGLVDRSDVHGVLVGRMVRLLRDAGRIDDAPTRLRRALSVGMPAGRKAAWVDGFFADGAALLVHDGELLGLLDAWVQGLAAQEFVDVLPLVRRTFGSFSAAERRSIAQRLQSGSARRSEPEPDVDEERAGAAVATVALVLGVDA